MISTHPLTGFLDTPVRRDEGLAPAQLVPARRLANCDKILFVTHLALGDFAYLQNFFQAFATAHPHIRIHLWVDERRRTWRRARWEFLRNSALYDWLESCPFIARTYRETYSPATLRKSIRDAQQEQFPLIVTFATLQSPWYISLSRKISPDAFIVGMRHPAPFYALLRRLAYRRLDASLDFRSLVRPGRHITNVYADCFRSLFGLDVPEAGRFPFVRIPALWDRAADEQLAGWQFDPASRRGAQLVFVNPYAKIRKRCWPLSDVAALIGALRLREEWSGAYFLVNVPPEEMEAAARSFAAGPRDRVRLFSAQENFFQLPAMLRRCDLIISVETAVMHLANAVHVPVIALMRQKNPEWAPIDQELSTLVLAPGRHDWVSAISVAQVLAALPGKPVLQAV